MTTRLRVQLLAPLALLAALAACSSAGVGGAPDGGLSAPEEEGATATITGEILANDPAAQMLRVRTDDGREGLVRWDAGTEVIYRAERYNPQALERGDRVQMRIERTSDGDFYTEYVLVTESVQERVGQPD